MTSLSPPPSHTGEYADLDQPEPLVCRLIAPCISFASVYIIGQFYQLAYLPLIGAPMERSGYVYPRFSARFTIIIYRALTVAHVGPFRPFGYIMRFSTPDWLDIHMIVVVDRLINLSGCTFLSECPSS